MEKLEYIHIPSSKDFRGDHIREIKIRVEKAGVVTDGYHSFDELYAHRIALFVALCREIAWHTDKHAGQCKNPPVWRSKTHGDGSTMDGWFVIGIGKEKGSQITYHVPIVCWEETDFAETLDRAPEWDGHTSADVLNRLKAL